MNRAVVIGVCAVALAGFAVHRSAQTSPVSVAEPPPTRPAAPEVSIPLEPSPSAVGITVTALPDVPPATVAAPRASGGAKAISKQGLAPDAGAAPPGLGDEITLIRAAQTDLRAGAPDRALASLAVHASRFPDGVLRAERMTLQVLALCERGDIDAARTVKADLERSSPGSSHLQRLASSCAR